MTHKTYVEMDDGGTYRVGGTRTRLDTIVYEYRQCGNAESIAEAFPAISMEDIYGALAFYLANRDEVDEYLKRREAAAEILRAQIEAGPVPPVVARLRALKAAKQNQP